MSQIDSYQPTDYSAPAQSLFKCAQTDSECLSNAYGADDDDDNGIDHGGDKKEMLRQAEREKATNLTSNKKGWGSSATDGKQ